MIAQNKNMVCFFEIKTRRSITYGLPYESVHRHKQRKLRQIAQVFLKQRFGTVDVPCRFDVISIAVDACGKEQLTHLPNAF